MLDSKEMRKDFFFFYRFARFMEGSSHLNDQEVLDFESNCVAREDISDDSSSDISDDSLSD